MTSHIRIRARAPEVPARLIGDPIINGMATSFMDVEVEAVDENGHVTPLHCVTSIRFEAGCHDQGPLTVHLTVTSPELDIEGIPVVHEASAADDAQERP